MITSFIIHEMCTTNNSMPPPNHLPTLIQPAALTVSDHPLVPALIAAEGNAAAWRYIEFFTANIRNPNTRRAYARACRDSSPGPKPGLTIYDHPAL